MKVTSNNKDSFVRQAFRSVLFIVNLFFVLLLLSSYLTWNISPEKNSFFAYLGLGFPFILAANIFFLFFWLVTTKWKFAAFNLVMLIVCIQPIWAYFPLNITSPTPSLKSLKILSYNVRGVGWKMDEEWAKKPIIQYLISQNADIICLQEYIASTDEKFSSSKKLQQTLKVYPYYYVESLRSKEGGYEYGLACFSKYKIKAVNRIPLLSTDNGAVLYQIEVGDKEITVINVHLESNRLTSSDKKMYRDFFKKRDPKGINKIAQNIESKLGEAYVKRAPQADMIAHYVAQQTTDATIVCGDFNDTPISYTYNKLRQQLVDSYTETRFGPSITYHENHFWFRIDYIWHTPNMKAYNFTIDKIKYSDHYPVWTYLDWKD